MQMCPCEAKWTVARCFVFLQSEWNKKRKRLIMLWIVDTLPLRYLCHWRHFKMPWILKINTLWIRLEFEMFTEMIHDSHNPPPFQVNPLLNSILWRLQNLLFTTEINVFFPFWRKMVKYWHTSCARGSCLVAGYREGLQAEMGCLNARERGDVFRTAYEQHL